MGKRYTSTPDVPRIEQGVTLFRSCLVSAEYPGVESSTKWLFERFGIEYTVNPAQTCCTGLGYYSDLMPIQTTVGIAARNACVVVDDEHPVMSYLCSTCYAINKKARNILDVPGYRAETNEVLGKIGREYDDRVAGTVQHKHTLEILWGAHDSVPELIRRRLDGIKVATHPACHYCKVFPDETLGNNENFMVPEEMLIPAGVVCTGAYNEKQTHCGAGFRNRFVNPSISVAVTQKKLHRLHEENVDVLVHMCPNCHVQFDRYSDIISAEHRRGVPLRAPARAAAPRAGARRRPREGRRRPDALPGRRAVPRAHRRPGRRDRGRRAMRAGVFLCECGGNISGVVDLEPLAEHARSLDGVVEVNVNQFMCGTEGRIMIEKAVEERGLDHFVIASCSPRFQGPTFERIARELKLGENAVAFGNIREGCSFIHKDEPERAQAKARKIVEGAVARLQHMSDLPRQRTFLNRSVLVVGGGIAGLSAAEELADAGIEVHLVEKQPSIGGYMSRLSKTFPTEDCAMCSLAPRLTNAATDSRIHIHALSDVTAITGPPGEFNVTVRHRPRYVDEKCVGCGECAAVCPVTYPNDFDFGVAERTAISRPFANAVPSTFAIDRKGWSPCKTACPVHTSAHGYVALVAKGRYDEAYRVASEPNPFPSVCGRICTHVCETECTRGNVEEPIAIAGIKRFVADNGAPAELPAPLPVFYDEPIAIVGGGPAGLTAARELAQFGYKATVFEALPVAGGMLRVGIPEYRLPRPALQGEVDRITALGVELRTGQRCGTDFTVDSLFADGYKAVFLATGLHQSKDLPIDGLDQQGVVRAVEFLRAQALGEKPTTGKRVVVVGGGDVAYDAGRTAFRCGADEVTLACIEDERTAPASSEEIEEGKEEQVHVEYSLVPVEILGTDGDGHRREVPALHARRAQRARLAPAGPRRGRVRRARGRHGDLRRRPGDRRRLPRRRRRRRRRARPDPGSTPTR